MVNNSRSYRSVRCNANQTQNSGDGKTLKRLMALEMGIVETALYLDAYPENKAALNYYKKLIEERQKLSDELARRGRPLTALEAGKGESWDWINSPWPWQTEANL